MEWRAGLQDVFQTNITTRDRDGTPLLRSSTGEIVRRTPTGYRILGRDGDLFFNPEGRAIPAFELVEARPAIFACWHWSLVQVADRGGIFNMSQMEVP